MTSEQRSNEDPVGAIGRIGRYEVLGVIGRGAFADVVRAWDQALASHVAIKFLNEASAQDMLLRDRFVEEGQLLRRIHSDHVIGIHDVGELPDGRPYLVVDLADGGTLAERLDQYGTGPVDADSLAQLISALASGLSAVHAAGIVHRDVKPDNLFITSVVSRASAQTVVRRGLLAPTERVVIGDLGLAKDLELRGSAPSIVGGSAGYQAPEQMRIDGEVGPTTDLYAATAVLWRLLSGTVPADSHTIAEQIGSFPSGWQEFFSRALDVRPGNRYSSALAWESAALDHLAREPSAQSRGRSSSFTSHPSVCPYKGLAAFQAEDAESFFGREQLVAELVHRLQQHRVLVVAGPSGSGKSSLVRAGLIPALRVGWPAGGQESQVDLITPGSQPFDELHYRLSALESWRTADLARRTAQGPQAGSSDARRRPGATIGADHTSAVHRPVRGALHPFTRRSSLC